LARNILALEKRIEDGEFDPVPLGDSLILLFHSVICGDLVPQLVGWRRTNVTVGEHEPPDFFKVPVLIREYGRDLQARLSVAGGASEILLEDLAFAEGRLLFIHPFADFNGRVTRVWLREILRRLDLPPVRLAPIQEQDVDRYLGALRAADRNDWRPLINIWRERFETGEMK
jgi:fido (protein-threonine AMPylation protein)